MKYSKDELNGVIPEEMKELQQYKIIIDKVEPAEKIIIEFIEKITNEDIIKTDGSDWKTMNKIFVDFEDPTKGDLKDCRTFEKEMLRDYGNNNGNPRTATESPRHYLAKVDGAEGKFRIKKR